MSKPEDLGLTSQGGMVPINFGGDLAEGGAPEGMTASVFGWAEPTEGEREARKRGDLPAGSRAYVVTRLADYDDEMSEVSVVYVSNNKAHAEKYRDAAKFINNDNYIVYTVHEQKVHRF